MNFFCWVCFFAKALNLAVIAMETFMCIFDSKTHLSYLPPAPQDYPKLVV